jgi:hypothetical protein
MGNRWYARDGRHNDPRIARLLMARGRDATDVALTTSFGPTALQGFKVWTDEVAAPPELVQAAANNVTDATEIPSDIIPPEIIPIESPHQLPPILPAHAQTATPPAA